MQSTGAQSASPGVQGTGAQSASPGMQSTGPLHRQQAMQHLVLKSGMRYEQGWLEWCEEALGLLRSFEQ